MPMTADDRLAEAEHALHELRVGKAAVEVRDSDGSMIRFTTANVSKLKTYIQELRDEIGGRSARRGPLRPIF